MRLFYLVILKVNLYCKKFMKKITRSVKFRSTRQTSSAVVGACKLCTPFSRTTANAHYLLYKSSAFVKTSFLQVRIQKRSFCMHKLRFCTNFIFNSKVSVDINFSDRSNAFLLREAPSNLLGKFRLPCLESPKPKLPCNLKTTLKLLITSPLQKPRFCTQKRSFCKHRVLGGLEKCRGDLGVKRDFDFGVSRRNKDFRVGWRNKTFALPLQKRSYTKVELLYAKRSFAQNIPQALLPSIESMSPESSLLQLKKIVSGEISKKPFLDILLTDLEQSSFSLIRQNKIEPKKCSKLRIIPPDYFQKSSFMRTCKSFAFAQAKLLIAKTSFLHKLRFFESIGFASKSSAFVKQDVSFIRVQGSKLKSIHKKCRVLCQVKTGDYVHCGDKIGITSIDTNYPNDLNIFRTPIIISESGKILKINSSQITIQKMQPVLFYSQAEIHVESNEWVKRGTPILTLAHQTLVTGDIVQGIPRIEQLFEASTSTPPGTSLQDFGSYYENDSSTKSLEKIYDYLHGFKEDTKNALGKSFALRLQKRSYVKSTLYKAKLCKQRNRGLALQSKTPPGAKTKFLQEKGKGIQNTDKLRQTKPTYTFTVHSTVEEKPLLLYKTLQSQVRELFRKKWNLLPLPVAVRQSLEEIQQIIVESIQKVYISQGVLIADKHIEIIVRQMTSKAQIFDGGSTGLLIDEILSLQQIENANISTPGQKALYLPVILGLTRAALSSDSFVSAASFQETTRVLSRDAVAGKSDFLRGLKEKVIIGDLIDAGTGLDVFYIYSLFSKKIFENKFSPNDNLKVTHKMLRKLVLKVSK